MLWTLLRSYFMQGFESSRSCSRGGGASDATAAGEIGCLVA